METGPAAQPTQRFSDRVENYVRFRPSYPDGVIGTLRDHAGLGFPAHVADIGSGTGIFSRLLLPHCDRVFGIEPNDAMRAAGERLLADDPRFISRLGTAEATGLPDASVDLVTVAQAFHWFDAPACRQEFLRILRPRGVVALLWNERLSTGTPFLVDYEALLHRRATDYAQVNHANIDAAAVAAFYSPQPFALVEFPNGQCFDFEGLKGRLLSSSYAPGPGHPGHAAMMTELETIFDRHAQDGVVTFHYTTRLYHGRLS